MHYKIIQAFSYFDRDSSGTIDYEEFKHILTTVSEKLSSKEVEKLDELCKSQVDENGRFKYVVERTIKTLVNIVESKLLKYRLNFISFSFELINYLILYS